MNYTRRHDTVAIVGSHPRTRGEFDFSRDVDIWVFNEAVKTETNSGFAPADKVDAVFQMHEEAIWKNPHNRNDANHYSWLRANTAIPVFMQDEYPEVPLSVKYPLEEIQVSMGANYFTSSVSYAIALGIYLGYKRIEMYGVEMETNTEYTYQRDCVTYWIGYARGAGIEMEHHSSLMDAPLYGYQGEVILDYQVFVDRIDELTPKCERLKALYEEQHEKTKDALTHTIREGTKAKEFGELLITMIQMGQEFGRLDGARQECERYRKKADAMREAAGEFLFSRQEFEGSLMGCTKGLQISLQKSQIAGGKFEAMFNEIAKTLNKKRRFHLMSQAAPVMEEYVRESVKTAMYGGAVEENRAYLAKLDKLIKAAGGAKSEEVLLAQLQGVSA